ncbi:glycine cleavage system protein GcvH [bacterium]|jgi:glycine cleavage system H protein|nr:glycine cleavage system protein GcvH [bacterium]
MIPDNLLFTEEHEWIKTDGDTITIGVTDYASEELGELVFVDLNDVDTELEKGDEFGSVESVKTVSGLFAPVDGEVSEVNNAVIDNPALINDEPYGKGWLIKMKVTGSLPEDLLTAAQYKAHLEDA